MQAATIIAQATPELPEVTRWEVWGPLGVMLAVGVIAFLSWFFLVFIPGQKERSKREERRAEREERIANAQIESLRTNSETGVALTKAYQRLVPLMTEIKQDHAEHRQEVGNLFSGVRKDIGQLHGRIDRLYERRSDGSIDCVRDD